MTHTAPPQNGNGSKVSYAWLAGIFFVIITSLAGAYVHSILSAQASENSRLEQVTADQQAKIASISSQIQDQTNILVRIGVKVGIPSTELQTILGARSSLETNLTN